MLFRSYDYGLVPNCHVFGCISVISDFFYLTAITVVFCNCYAFVDKKIRHIVFVLNFIDSQVIYFE